MADPLGAVASSNLKGLASRDPAFFIAVAGKILALDQAGRSFSIMSSFLLLLLFRFNVVQHNHEIHICEPQVFWQQLHVGQLLLTKSLVSSYI